MLLGRGSEGPHGGSEGPSGHAVVLTSTSWWSLGESTAAAFVYFIWYHVSFSVSLIKSLQENKTNGLCLPQL